MNTNDYCSFKITKPTQATIDISVRDEQSEREIVEIAHNHIFQTFRPVAYDQYTGMVFELTDDEALDLFDAIVKHVKSIFYSTRFFNFEMKIRYMYPSHDWYFERVLGFESTSGPDNSGIITNKSRLYVPALNQLNARWRPNCFSCLTKCEKTFAKFLIGYTAGGGHTVTDKLMLKLEPLTRDFVIAFKPDQYFSRDLMKKYLSTVDSTLDDDLKGYITLNFNEDRFQKLLHDCLLESIDEGEK